MLETKPVSMKIREPMPAPSIGETRTKACPEYRGDEREPRDAKQEQSFETFEVLKTLKVFIGS